MENPIKMDDLGVPLFSETPLLRTTNRNNNGLLEDSMFIPDSICFMV